MNKVWLITGVSSGFGRALVNEIVRHGDIAIGTLRRRSHIKAFNAQYHGGAKAVMADVTNTKQVRAAVKYVMTKFGRIDVLVNNAGYGLFGAIEEISLKEARAQMETNYFGALRMTKAVLPHMRKAKSGLIVQMSSSAGIQGSPGLGLYNGSKFALEGASEALAAEVGPLGIKVMIVEPGPFRTKFCGSAFTRAARRIDAYAGAHARIAGVKQLDGNQVGDPRKAARVIREVAESGEPPLRLPLSGFTVERMREKLASTRRTITAWEAVARNTTFDPPPRRKAGQPAKIRKRGKPSRQP